LVTAKRVRNYFGFFKTHCQNVRNTIKKRVIARNRLHVKTRDVNANDNNNGHRTVFINEYKYRTFVTAVRSRDNFHWQNGFSAHARTTTCFVNIPDNLSWSLPAKKKSRLYSDCLKNISNIAGLRIIPSLFPPHYCIHNRKNTKRVVRVIAFLLFGTRLRKQTLTPFYRTNAISPPSRLWFLSTKIVSIIETRKSVFVVNLNIPVNP